MDALWLASGPYALDIARAASDTSGTLDTSESKPKQADPAATKKPLSDRTGPEEVAPLPQPKLETPAANDAGYDQIAPKPSEAAIPATSLGFAGAETLSERLPLTRALRPFRQPFPSVQVLELDEEGTAELTAEMRAARLRGIFAVQRPKRERWFQVDIVREADPAATLWDAQLEELAHVLQQSGAFRLVRNWRLTLDSREPADLSRAKLENIAGVTISPKQIGIDRRHLVLFASHGASRHWQDGCYAQLLKRWSNGALALVHLLSPAHRLRSGLGEPHGTGWAMQSGAPAAEFASRVAWWRCDVEAESPNTLRLPMTTLDPTAFSDWAMAQMARGRTTPIFLLDARERQSFPSVKSATELSSIDAEQRLAQLRERSSAAYELAIALSVGPFTLPVARVVQEVMFGSANDTALLGDLLLSGVVALDDRSAHESSSPPVFRVANHAASFLERASRSEDRLHLAAELRKRVGAHLKRDDIGLTVVVPDPRGQSAIPAGLQPFAEFARGLISRPLQVPAKDWGAFFQKLERRHIGYLYRLWSRHPVIDKGVRPEILDWMVAEDLLIGGEAAGSWDFRPEVIKELQAATQGELLYGASILWVDDVPRNNAPATQNMRKGGVNLVEVTSTAEALDRSDLELFDLIVSDMSRPPERNAGFDLIAALQKRGITAPIIIFAGYFAQSEKNRNRVIEAGAFGCTNDFGELHAMMAEALDPWRAGWLSPPDGSDARMALQEERARLLWLLRFRAGLSIAARANRTLDEERSRILWLLQNRPPYVDSSFADNEDIQSESGNQDQAAYSESPRTSDLEAEPGEGGPDGLWLGFQRGIPPLNASGAEQLLQLAMTVAQQSMVTDRRTDIDPAERWEESFNNTLASLGWILEDEQENRVQGGEGEVVSLNLTSNFIEALRRVGFEPRTLDRCQDVVSRWNREETSDPRKPLMIAGLSYNPSLPSLGLTIFRAEVVLVETTQFVVFRRERRFLQSKVSHHSMDPEILDTLKSAIELKLGGAKILVPIYRINPPDEDPEPIPDPLPKIRRPMPDAEA